MSNTSLTYLQGDCVAPFYDASRFPLTGGAVADRFCATIGGASCCLPCPAMQWVYPNNFEKTTLIAEWLNVPGIALLCFMLLSYLVLPAQQTRSHYLSVCLILSVLMIAIGFTIPLGADPPQCYNEITPNDMYSLAECAWSGAFIIAGALAAGMWILIRALSMHLQICWDIVPGRKFFYVSQAFGWGVPAALFTVTMTITGVSFRFGRACHVNHSDSMADFWGWLLAFAGTAGLLQLGTFAYCVRVYLRNLLHDSSPAQSTNVSGSALPTYSGSVRTQTAGAVWRRLQKVLWLQWRGIVIVTILLVDVVFFSIVFVRVDNLQTTVLHDLVKIEPWIECLAFNPTERTKCLPLVKDWLPVGESIVVAVLFMLGLTGVEVFLFLTRPSIFPAWIDFLRGKFGGRQEFVSLDAARPDVPHSTSKQGFVTYNRGHESTAFEMQQRPNPHTTTTIPAAVAARPPPQFDTKSLETTNTAISSPDDVYRPPTSATWREHADEATSPSSMLASQQSHPYQLQHITRVASPSSQSHRSTSQQPNPPDYYGRSSPAPPRAGSSHSSHADRRYMPPTSSFSAPTAPSRNSSLRSATFDPREGHSRGGLALNPPTEVSESSEDLDLRQQQQQQRWQERS